MLMAKVLRKLIRESSLLAPDSSSFKRQESAFVVLNLLVLSTLLLLHTLFSSYFGTPPRTLIAVLAVGFFLNVVELIWVQSTTALSATAMIVLTCLTILLNMTLAFVLASLSYRQDTQYFALLAAPVLQAAFRFPVAVMFVVLVATTTLEFFWVWNYFRLHPPSELNEYMEAGTIALIYATVGILVWTLVNYLRTKQLDLERARQQLSIEEKLAAVGRFSSAIAHEIRNPVAMISSALATTRNGDISSSEREEMFEIARKEASRLEKLTADFLVYARPRPPVKERSDVSTSVAYIADICSPHAAERTVTIQYHAPDELCAFVDSGQLQQALLNLTMNAVEASPAGGVVLLRARREENTIRLDVENANGPIPREVVGRIFEPFFTTRSTGTGLGLAIARNITRAHGGELVLARNEPGSVRFSMTLPAYTEVSEHS